MTVSCSISTNETSCNEEHKLARKMALEGNHDDDDNNNNNNSDKTRFEVYPFIDPLLALSQFKPNFYDLLLTDIYMPCMNGFELCQKIVEFDVNIRICFMSAAEINIQALREVYPKLSLGCFIRKQLR